MEVDVSKGIEVGPFHYEVLQGGEHEKHLESGDAFGRCENIHRRILLTNNFSSQQFNNTFMHECIEAANCVLCNNKLKHDDIINIANGLSQIFKGLGITFVYGGNHGNNRRDD